MFRVERVVLIDDNELDNVFHDWALRKAGFEGEIIVFDSGEAAVDGFSMADLSRRTVIFLDINMPGMDGFAVAEKLAPILANHPNVTIVMLTSSEAREDRARAKSIEVIRGYVPKPLAEAVVLKLFAAIDWGQTPPHFDLGEYQL
jgi:CheY-like chemotaxis protein